MRRNRKLTRRETRREIIRILKEAYDPSTTTIQQLIDAGNIEDINSVMDLLRDAKRGARGAAKAERASSAAEKTAKAKQIIAYYLTKYIAGSDLSMAGGDLDAEKEIFQQVVPKKSKVFDKTSMSVKEMPHKFTLKECELLVFWTFHEIGVELKGGKELRDAKNPANYGTDSARLYATNALKELEEEGVIITNVGATGYRPTSKRMGLRSDAPDLTDTIGDFDGDDFRRGPMNEIRKLILKEIAEIAPVAGLEIGGDIDIEYAFDNDSIPKLQQLANMLSPDEATAVENVVGTYQIGFESDLGESSSLDSYASDLNDGYLDEEIDLSIEDNGPSPFTNEDFDFDGDIDY